MDKNLITTKQLCEWLNINKDTANRWRKAGLPCKKVGNKMMYDKIDVTEWMNTHNTRIEIPKDSNIEDIFKDYNHLIKYLNNIVKTTSKEEFLKLSEQYGTKEYVDLIKNISDEQYRNMNMQALISMQHDIRAFEMAEICAKYRFTLLFHKRYSFDPSLSSDELSDAADKAICDIAKFINKLDDILTRNTGDDISKQVTDADIQELKELSK